MTQIEVTPTGNSKREWLLILILIVSGITLVGFVLVVLSFVLQPSLTPAEAQLVGDWIVTSPGTQSGEVSYRADRMYLTKIPGLGEGTGRWEIVGDELVEEWPASDSIWGKLQFLFGRNTQSMKCRFRAIDLNHVEIVASGGAKHFLTRQTNSHEDVEVDRVDAN